MHKRILSAVILTEEDALDMDFSPSVNILCGQYARDVLLTLAGIFGGIPPRPFKAVLNWQDDVTLFVSGENGCVFVNNLKAGRGDPVQLQKRFHKQRFLRFRNNTHILDGSQLSAGTSGASDLLLNRLADALAQKDDRPLFICNFLERLDEAIELQSIFEALNAAGRQVFIVVPRYCRTKTNHHKINL